MTRLRCFCTVSSAIAVRSVSAAPCAPRSAPLRAGGGWELHVTQPSSAARFGWSGTPCRGRPRGSSACTHAHAGTQTHAPLSIKSTFPSMFVRRLSWQIDRLWYKRGAEQGVCLFVCLFAHRKVLGRRRQLRLPGARPAAVQAGDAAGGPAAAAARRNHLLLLLPEDAVAHHAARAAVTAAPARLPIQSSVRLNCSCVGPEPVLAK